MRLNTVRSKKFTARRERNIALGNIALGNMERLEPRQLLAAHIAGNSTAYETIQAAIDAATAGATITVDAGEYNELVTVDKPLTLQGALAGTDARDAARGTDESVVRGQDFGGGNRSTAFYVTADNVTLDGFTVQDDTSTNQFGAGIVLAPKVSGTHVVNNIVRHNVAGLYLSSYSATARQTLIRHNVFDANNNAGGNSGRGIYTDGGISGGNLTNVLIDDNTFTANHGADMFEAAVSLETQAAGQQSHITITHNQMHANGKGVLLMNASDVTIADNTITGSTDVGSAAVRIEGGSTHISVTGNVITNNGGAAVRIDDRFNGANSDITITGNQFADNAGGGLLVSANGYTGTLDARDNWWGHASGPSGDGPGTGQSLVANGVAVNYTPWRTSPTGEPTPQPPPPTPKPAEQHPDPIPAAGTTRAKFAQLADDVRALRTKVKDAKARRSLLRVAAAIDASVDASLWRDDAHLDPDSVSHFFALHRQALHHLLKAQGRHKHSAKVLAAADLAKRLLNLDRTLVTLQMDDSWQQLSLRRLKEVKRELLKAAVDFRKGRGDRGLERLTKAAGRVTITPPAIVPPVVVPPVNVNPDGGEVDGEHEAEHDD